MNYRHQTGRGGRDRKLTSRRSGEFAPKVYALEVCDASARSALPLLPLPHFADSLAQDLDNWGEFPNFAHYLYRQGKIPFFTAFGIVTFPVSHRAPAYTVNRIRHCTTSRYYAVLI